MFLAVLQSWLHTLLLDWHPTPLFTNENRSAKEPENLPMAIFLVTEINLKSFIPFSIFAKNYSLTLVFNLIVDSAFYVGKSLQEIQR